MTVNLCRHCGSGYCFFCNDDEPCCCYVGEEITSEYKQYKDDDEVTDITSTGRKRAAELYPIKKGYICEWAFFEKAGGGIIPVRGCEGKEAVNIHHGPDKSTLNNRGGNVHRICANCHNLWHARNNQFYPEERPKDGSEYIPLEEFRSEYKLHDPNGPRFSLKPTPAN